MQPRVGQEYLYPVRNIPSTTRGDENSPAKGDLGVPVSGANKSSQTSNLLHRNMHRHYPVITHGKGIYLYDEDGKAYIDGCSGAMVANIGHGVEEVAEAMYQQAKTLSFTHSSRFTSRPTIELAERIRTLTPGDLNHVFFVSGGSEATESAIKLARTFFLETEGMDTTRWKVISRLHSYHGGTLGAVAVTGHIPRRRKYEPMLVQFPLIAPAYCYRCTLGLTHPECDLACARELEKAIVQNDPKTIAAFIAEPIVGAAAGAVPPPDGYFERIRQICDQYGVLFIADEVMTGFGRTGEIFAMNHWDIVPDIIACAKGMGAGYAPLGGVALSDKIADALVAGSGQFSHGFTYSGNPLACSAGLAVLDFVQKHDLVRNSRDMGNVLFEELELLKDNPIVGDIRGRGLFAGIELVRDRTSKECFAPSLSAAERVTQECVQRGLVVYPGTGMVEGTMGDQFIVGPPLTITRDEISEVVARLDAALEAAAGQLL